MSDKKVGRSSRSPISPTEQMERALSDPGTVNVADMRHDKGKTSIAHKFQEREERWRREQSLHDQQAAHGPEQAERPGAEAERAAAEAAADVERPAGRGDETAERRGGEEGGGA